MEVERYIERDRDDDAKGVGEHGSSRHEYLASGVER